MSVQRHVYNTQRILKATLGYVYPIYSKSSVATQHNRPNSSRSRPHSLVPSRSLDTSLVYRTSTTSSPLVSTSHPRFSTTQEPPTSEPDSVSFAELATVDLSPFFTESLDPASPTPAQIECANRIGHAATSLGFLYVSHSPLVPLLPYVNTAAKWFFDQSTAARHSTRTSNTQRGYHHFIGSPHTVPLHTLSNDADTQGQHSNSSLSSQMPSPTTQLPSIQSKNVNVDHIEAYTMQSPWLSSSDLRQQYDRANDEEIFDFRTLSNTSPDFRTHTSSHSSSFPSAAPPLLPPPRSSTHTPPPFAFPPPPSASPPLSSTVTSSLSPCSAPAAPPPPLHPHFQNRMDNGRNPYQNITTLSHDIVLPYTNLQNKGDNGKLNPDQASNSSQFGKMEEYPDDSPVKSFLPENYQPLDKFRWLLEQEAKKNDNSQCLKVCPSLSSPLGNSPFGLGNPPFGAQENEGEYNRWPDTQNAELFSPEKYEKPYNPTGIDYLSQNTGENSETAFLNSYVSHLPSFPLVMDAQLFKKIAISYYSACIITSEAITQALCLFLGADPRKILDLHQLASHTLEMKKYPAVKHIKMSESAITSLETGKNTESERSRNSEESNSSTSVLSDLQNIRLRFPVHSDLSTVTLLTQTHDKGGLMLKCLLQEDDIFTRTITGSMSTNTGDTLTENSDVPTKTGFSSSSRSHRWLRAPMRSNTVIVNTGDFFYWMTGGKVQSTLHCVASNAEETKKIDLETKNSEKCGNSENEASSSTSLCDEPRFSTVFFYQPDMHATIEPLYMRRYDDNSSNNENMDHEYNAQTPKRLFEPFMAGDRYPYL